ncbi:serine/threonine-protein kinase [Microbulbifer yueqingensis]|uniref:Serine/threonine protein kinase n=1 Tax=Microbulbifer yueqingensis TaxID=658219 RepID=A0A1G8XWZ4_9GAMM|nr:serine/threonine-protein kinase [Microbulbifer yueqingensis]SDJ95021.1 Serine/threonine protein kinase [Microbulbifer yueqingensis]
MEIAEPAQTILGRYRLERALGAGGMGVVYLARDSKLHRQVAIKQLRADATSDSAAARIRSEARLLAQLNHPNIVQLHDVIERDGDIALVMEYVEGTTLKEWMRERTPTLREKLDLLMQVCRGLTEAHRLGIVHRDLKPDNILIATGSSGITAKITDFGIAKSLQQDSTEITRADHVAGTVDAMSPEQLQGEPLCPRSDLFSLGTIAYQLLCGARPFDKGDGGSLALAHKVIHDPHIPPQQACPELPGPLAALLDRLLAKQPQKRPESAQQVYEALAFLHQHQADDADSGELSATVTQLLRKPPSQRRKLYKRLGYAAGLALASIGALFFLYFPATTVRTVAVLDPDFEGIPADSRILLAHSIEEAMRDSVIHLEELQLIPNREIAPLKGRGYREIVAALNPDIVLLPQVRCRSSACDVTIERIDTPAWNTTNKVNFPIIAPEIFSSAQATHRETSKLFPEFTGGDTAADSIYSTQATYLKYIQLHRIVTQKLGLTRDTLGRIRSLIEEYPESFSSYQLLLRAAGELLARTQDREILIEVRNLLTASRITSELRKDQLWMDYYLLAEDTRMADKRLKMLESSGLNSYDWLMYKNRLSYMQGEYHSAAESLERAVLLRPTYKTYFNLGLAQYRINDFENSLKSFEKALQLYPEFSKALSMVAALHFTLGDLEKAISAYRELISKERSPYHLNNLAFAYMLTDNSAKAEPLFAEARKLAPQAGLYALNHGESLLAQARQEEAQEAYSAAAALTKGTSTKSAILVFALASAHLERREDAIKALHSVIDSSSNDMWLNYDIARTYLQLKDYSSAKIYLQRSINSKMNKRLLLTTEFVEACVNENFRSEFSSICPASDNMQPPK